MNSIVCSVTLIYLCLGKVAGSIGKLPRVPAPPVAHRPTEKVEVIDSSVRKLTCGSQKKWDHHWYQFYLDGNSQQPTYIGNIPIQKSVKTTHFTLQLETFDNNTKIQCDKVHNWFLSFTTTETGSLYQMLRIGTNQILKGYKEPAVMKYNETQKVSFKCQEYINRTNLVIGVINTISNRIEIYSNTFLNRIFNKWQNGTILCCIYYEVHGTADEKWITRHVAKKTLLVYDETVTVPVTDRRDSSEDIDKNSSTSTDEDTKRPNVIIGNQDGNPGNQDADSGNHDADSGKQDADSGKEDPGSSNQATIIYTVSAVAVVILLVVSAICLKRCRKKPKVEVEDKVLYADLEFLRRNEPESLPREGPEEECPYAQIIGELSPRQT